MLIDVLQGRLVLRAQTPTDHEALEIISDTKRIWVGAEDWGEDSLRMLEVGFGGEGPNPHFAQGLKAGRQEALKETLRQVNAAFEGSEKRSTTEGE